MKTIGTDIKNWNPKNVERNRKWMDDILNQFKSEENKIREGGGTKRIEIQHKKGRLTARERIEKLLDKDAQFFELSIYAAWGMYEEYGSPPAAGVIAGIGKVSDHDCVIVANDATVKAGAYFEMTLKKNLRAQKIALENNLPIIYLVDSAGVFLPLQDQVFPDEAHFGRIFFNNARLSALGIPQIASVMGPCVAGGAYLPVMCDKFLMTEGSNMFLAGPALVKAAIGQDIDSETLGGATTHNAISGTADYHPKDDDEALQIIRNLMEAIGERDSGNFNRKQSKDPLYDFEDLNGVVSENGSPYDINEILARILDSSEFEPYKDEYGKTVICGHGRIGGYSVGIVTNQDKIPLIFLHDVNGFMVGRDSEWGGIAKDGAKMVQAVSNSVVPKITIIIGGSYGAGYYAMSGRAYDTRFMFMWPSAKLVVMGGSQAANTLAEIRFAKMKGEVSDEERKKVVAEIKANYDKQSDPRYAAARMWTDAIIEPGETRNVLIRALEICEHQPKMPTPSFGVLQV